MISALQAFLIESAKAENIKDYTPSKRLKDHPFKIRAITTGEYREARQRAINPDAEGGARIDPVELSKQVIIIGCVEPNFKDEEFLKQAGCAIPGMAIDKLLLAGEVTKLSNEIMDLSGYGEDVENLRQQAKN